MQHPARNFDYLDLERRPSMHATGVMTDPQLERFGLDPAATSATAVA
ncbi:MAG: hypothetical protein JWN72_15, partial [Thermoleophilia bacterium]|nr:hypothetical protein [Thermoleophilia bacterium]